MTTRRRDVETGQLFVQKQHVGLLGQAADAEIVVRARGRLGTENVDLLVNDSVVA